MKQFYAIKREAYENKILKYAGNKNIIFMMGARHCGKTCIAMNLEEELKKICKKDEIVARFNFETADANMLKVGKMFEVFKKHYKKGRKMYILLDEVTRIQEWYEAVNYMNEFPECKLFIFSSNTGVLSNRLNAVREGTYNIIHVLPLSFEEFILFQEFKEITPAETEITKKRYLGPNDKEYTIQEVFGIYITYGGLPIMRPEHLDRERARVVLDGTYSSIVVRDIMEADKIGNESSITDPVILRHVITILSNSIGNNISATWVKKYMAEKTGKRSATKTVEMYMRALLSSHLFYMSERYDIRTDKKLKTLAKYYVVDAGIHNYLVGIEEEKKKILENKVFFELMRRDYEVLNGKIGNQKIDLVAVKGKRKIYIQVAYEFDSETLKDYLSSLRKVRDNHLKVLISFRNESCVTTDGIIILNALEFLMGQPLIRYGV